MRTVVFDLDGTLVESMPDLRDALLDLNYVVRAGLGQNRQCSRASLSAGVDR